MRIHLSILAVGALCVAVTAQTTYQRWDMHPGQTSFTSRGNIGTGTGQIFQGVHASTNRGVLGTQRGSSTSCAIGRVNTITQDQNCSTREKFGWIVRGGTDSGGPGTGAGAILGTITGLSLPNSANTGACAWGLTSTLAPTARIKVPVTRMYGYGLSLGPSPKWTADGQSIHASRSADFAAANTHRVHGAASQEDQGWQIVGAATAASNPSQKRSWRLSIDGADVAVMKLRCDGRQGYGGSYPASSTPSTALAWDAQLNGGSGSGGAATVAIVGASRSTGSPMPPYLAQGNCLFLNGPFLFLFGPAASASGVGVVPLLPLVPATAAGAGTFHLQAALGLASGVKMTNSQSVTP
jgi:hypothetical protein